MNERTNERKKERKKESRSPASLHNSVPFIPLVFFLRFLSPDFLKESLLRPSSDAAYVAAMSPWRFWRRVCGRHESMTPVRDTGNAASFKAVTSTLLWRHLSIKGRLPAQVQKTSLSCQNISLIAAQGQTFANWPENQLFAPMIVG